MFLTIVTYAFVFGAGLVVGLLINDNFKSDKLLDHPDEVRTTLKNEVKK